VAKKTSAADDPKRRQRLDAKERAAAVRRRAERRVLLRNLVLGVVAFLALAAGLFILLRPDPEVAGVERPPDKGREHVDETQIQYDSAAPTSGSHLAGAPNCGSLSDHLELGLAVHAVEHGAVIVWYQPDQEEELADPLRDFLSEWDSHWILSPNGSIDEPIVATAWSRRKTFDSPSEGLREFVQTYRQRGPEKVPCGV